MKTFLKLIGLTLLSLRAVLAADEPLVAEPLEDAQIPPSGVANLRVKITTSFPNAEIFGVKLVNRRTTDATVKVENNEDDAVSVRLIGGSLIFPENAGIQAGKLVKNLTTITFDGSIAPGSWEAFTYPIQTDLHAQDLHLRMACIIQDKQGRFFTLPAYNETVSIVEAPISIFDPQILLLYLILAALFGGTSYFVYQRYITVLFPQTKRRTGRKDGDRSRGPKSAEKVAVVGSDGPATTTAAKAYDESWIPAHHLKRPEAKRARSGTPTGVKTKSRPA